MSLFSLCINLSVCTYVYFIPYYKNQEYSFILFGDLMTQSNI